MKEESNEKLIATIRRLEEENRLLRDRLAQKECLAENKLGRIQDDRLLCQVFETLPDMVTMIDYAGNIVKVLANNHAGCPDEDLVSQPITRILNEESAFNLSESLRRSRTTGCLSVGFHDITIDNVTRHYEHRVLPFDENSVLCICRDVTLAQRNKQEVDELNFLLNTIIDSLPVYLFVKEISNGMKYLFWNRAFAEASGIPAEKVIGHTDDEFFPRKEDGEKFMEDDRELLESGDFQREYVENYQTVNGELLTVSTRKVITPVLEGGKRLLIGASMDITNLKKVERELEEAKALAVKNDMTKSVFLSNMGHEIRTPVNAIVGFANLLNEVEDEEERQQYINIIESNSNLLLKLIEDILDISKIEAGTLKFTREEVDLDRLCSNLQVMHSQNVREGVKLIYDTAGTNLSFYGDTNRVMQVLTNFVTNACKFTHQGEIHYGFEELEDHAIRIYVKDSGVGIAEEKLPAVFDRFVRLDAGTVGTGLGLAICKMIVEKMGGTIGATSRKNEGSTFYFIVPGRND